MRQVLGAGALGRPRGMGWGGRPEGGLGWGTHVNPRLIHVNVWQKPLQYCKVINFQLIKINEKKMFRICLWNYLFKSLHLPPIFKHIMFQYTRLLIVSVMHHAVPSSSTFEYAGPFTWKARFLLLCWANTCLFFQTLHKTFYSLTSLADHCQTEWITTTTDPLSYLAHTSIRRKVIQF